MLDAPQQRESDHSGESLSSLESRNTSLNEESRRASLKAKTNASAEQPASSDTANARASVLDARVPTGPLRSFKHGFRN